MKWPPVSFLCNNYTISLPDYYGEGSRYVRTWDIMRWKGRLFFLQSTVCLNTVYLNKSLNRSATSKFVPSWPMTLIQRRLNVDATSRRYINAEPTLYKCHVPAGYFEISRKITNCKKMTFRNFLDFLQPVKQKSNQIFIYLFIYLFIFVNGTWIHLVDFPQF